MKIFENGLRLDEKGGTSLSNIKNTGLMATFKYQAFNKDEKKIKELFLQMMGDEQEIY